MDITEGIKNETPRQGIAEYICNDPFTKHMYEDDQLTYQVASVYYREKFRIDKGRYFLSMIAKLTKPLLECRLSSVGYEGIGQASLLHCAGISTPEEHGKWDTWVTENGLV